jgi:hypothetical protein
LAELPVVSPLWIHECLVQQKLLDYRNYEEKYNFYLQKTDKKNTKNASTKSNSKDMKKLRHGKENINITCTPYLSAIIETSEKIIPEELKEEVRIPKFIIKTIVFKFPNYTSLN